MSEFDWVDAGPISDKEYARLNPAEIVQREEALAIVLRAFTNQWVEIRNSAVVKSAETLNELMDRKPKGEVIFVPPEEDGESFFSQIAA